MESTFIPATIGFLLSGPLGLAVAESTVLDTAIRLGLQVSATAGRTPGLVQDYEALITQSLMVKGIGPVVGAEAEERSDTIVCVGWRSMVKTYGGSKRVFVMHDSLLPELRGWNPLVTAIEIGLEQTGVTLFQAGEIPDTGPIILQKSFELGPGISIAQAVEKAGDLAASLLDDFIQQFSQGEVTSRAQDESLASISPWRNNDDYLVQWSDSSAQVERFSLSRGFPYLGAQTTINGVPLTIGSAKAVQGLPELAVSSPGKTIAIEEGNPIVACGSGYVELDGLRQRDGARYTVEHLRTRFGT